MAILSSIQRRSPGGRVLIGTMYLLLTVGAVWMVYPFLLMLSGSVKTEVDIRQFDIIPRYLYNDDTLYRKYLEQRYRGSLDIFGYSTRYHDADNRPAFSFEFVQPPAATQPAVLDDWREFFSTARSWPQYFIQIGHGTTFRHVGELTMEYRQRLYRAFPKLDKVTELSVHLPYENWLSRDFLNVTGPFTPVYEQLRAEVPLRYFAPVSIEGYFALVNLSGNYGAGAAGIRKLNAKWGTNFRSMFEVTMSATPPANPAQRADWWTYVQDSLSARFIRLQPSLQPQFQQFLADKYKVVTALNSVYETTYRTWNEIPLPAGDAPSPAFADVQTFLKMLPGPDGISLDGPDFRWREFLLKKYGDDVAALNRAHGANYQSFSEPIMPVLSYDWAMMKENHGPIVRELLTRNYRIVLDYLSNQGRAFRNTIVFCALNVLTALIVNPLAAYALSRFQPKWGYAVLFVLMATMAFPAEVTQIPSFLMLRQLGFLNTFAALIVPAAANGYSIFLLKGFFDSLPKELYESATLDGAGELRIFVNITLALSMPILAVIALGAFTAAYGAFMFALLVCQDQGMWTVMVYIYQLQNMFGTPIVFAALVLAAIPTLLVFVFCQNIIMRGIVVPVEK